MGDRSGGFSLLELMIVVAVAAILVMIAMPNYQRMVERVKLNQGKMALASLHSAEKIFYAEYESYTTRLDAVGFLLEGKTYFEIGFDILPRQIPIGRSDTVISVRLSLDQIRTLTH